MSTLPEEEGKLSGGEECTNKIRKVQYRTKGRFYEKFRQIIEQFFSTLKGIKRSTKDSAGFSQDWKESHLPEELDVTEKMNECVFSGFAKEENTLFAKAAVLSLRKKMQ